MMQGVGVCGVEHMCAFQLILHRTTDGEHTIRLQGSGFAGQEAGRNVPVGNPQWYNMNCSPLRINMYPH